MPNNSGSQGLRGTPEQCGDSNRPKRVRKPSVARVIQQMKRAGVEIAGCEINPRDGTVRVLARKPVDGGDVAIDEAATDRSEWG